jgi:hypothetical protein
MKEEIFKIDIGNIKTNAAMPKDRIALPEKIQQ